MLALHSGLVGALATASIPKTDYTAVMAVNSLFSLAGQVLVMPISAAAFILLYYDLRIRKEGFDLEMLAKDLASRGADSDAATPTQGEM